MVDSAGSRKGREPVGEAWFVEGRRWNLTPAIRRKVCHMNRVSLKLPKWCWYLGGDARRAEGERVEAGIGVAGMWSSKTASCSKNWQD